MESCWSRRYSDDYFLNNIVNIERHNESYENAVQLMKNNDFNGSYKIFSEILRDFSFSNLARKSLLMAAFSQYSAGKYKESATLGEQYLAQYPGSQNIDYVYYLVGMSYANMIRDVHYDQQPARLMLQYMSQIVRQYKDSVYFKGARFYVTVARNQLAAKEMDIGRYYLDNGEYTSSILRFQLVVEQYSDTEQLEEAMVRLVESYFALGLMDEARDMAFLIQEQYPQGYWSQYVRKLVQSNNKKS
ncbi:outer membrane protein assembly factor BamD [Candidatus Liberibacter africanus]|uniref:outer membrane protein assembly factor BamD n=1 Tax=Liberibacter africanus TaxID=34020 RepID=UPI001FCE27F7|nr:outer membrane protein assembly factor BamD [Candidatus Liberibacter africanus]